MATNKYVQDIRKIVGVDVNQSTLGPAARKASIGGKRGIAYFNSDRQTTSSQSGSPGQTLASPQPTGSLASTSPVAGNFIDPTNPSANSQYGYNDGTFDADDDLFDNLPGITDPTGSGIGGNQAGSNSTLNGIIGLIDPVTGDAVELRFDRKNRPPEDWYDEGTPLDGSILWVQGIQWYAPGASYGPTALSAAETQKNLVHSDYTTLISSTFVYFPHAGGTARYNFVWERPSDSATVSYYAQDETCTGTEGDPFCPLSNPIKYPSDASMQLVLTEGKWLLNQYEALVDIIPEYTDAQHSRLDLEFGTGRTLSIIPTVNAGYIIGETVSLGGAFSSDNNRLFDASGKVVDFVSNGGVSAYLPQ